jgi:uncharacterized protein
MINRPVPVADYLTEFYWEGAKKEQLLIQRCQLCGHWNHPPTERCPECGASELKPEQVPLRGEVFSYCVTYQSRISGFEEQVPYLVAIVKIDTIPIKIALNLLNTQPETVHIGMPVDIIFEHRNGISLPQAIPRKM